MKRQRTIRGQFAFAMILVLLSWGAIAHADSLRSSTMGNCFIAQIDEDSGLNPYDYGRNPAYLIYDFTGAWNRFILSFDHTTGDLKRPYDAGTVQDVYAGFVGQKKLSDRQVAWGSFRYGQLRQEKLTRAIEIDPYNDPFYLTDTTTADITYYGPSMKVDYSLRISPKLSFGAGFDYDISTGLKDYYTRPQIIHNYFKGSIGFLYQPGPKWRIGVIGRPIRMQNRTEFDKTDEGFDNLIRRYSGDGIYEIRTFQGYTIRELLWGGEFDVQGFYSGERLTVGTIATYCMAQNKIKYNLTYPEETGFWQDQSWGVKLLARYAAPGSPLVLGLSGEMSKGAAWAKRPRFDDVLLYDNPTRLGSVGAGASYSFRDLGLVVSSEYVLNAYNIEADDYGANKFPKVDITQNIGRLGIEYSAYNVYAVRAGIEVTDYPIDRWLKLPPNMTRYRATCGLGYTWHFWNIEGEFRYDRSTKEGFDGERRDLSGVLWFTRSQI